MPSTRRGPRSTFEPSAVCTARRSSHNEFHSRPSDERNCSRRQRERERERERERAERRVGLSPNRLKNVLQPGSRSPTAKRRSSPGPSTSPSALFPATCDRCDGFLFRGFACLLSAAAGRVTDGCSIELSVGSSSGRGRPTGPLCPRSRERIWRRRARICQGTSESIGDRTVVRLHASAGFCQTQVRARRRDYLINHTLVSMQMTSARKSRRRSREPECLQ
jgi:hypothetical protein